MRMELRYSPLELLKQAQQALADMPDDRSASIDINVDGRHYKISNTKFVKTSILAIDTVSLASFRLFTDDFSEGGHRDKVRAIDYYIVKTLLDYLPIHITMARTGHYTQEERNFGLSVLCFLGRLPDIDRDGVCSFENNATFDKLMRDFKSYPIPFAMEMFL